MPQPLELSVQLYSLRHMPDLADQLRLVQEAGLTHVEATSSNYKETDRMASLCRDLGLSVPSGHIGIDRLRSDMDGVIASAKALGIHTLVLWGLPEDETPRSAQAWRAAGVELGGFANRLAASGLRIAFHNHDWELQVFEDGERGLDHLFEGAGNAPLFWQADLAWLARGGADVEAVLKSHAARLISAHVKDMAPAGGNSDEDGWADLGHGILPWREWWRWLRNSDTSLLVLEHDEPSDPARFLNRSAAFAKQLEASI
jgi:sugar phosphate isomerase/epimerase